MINMLDKAMYGTKDVAQYVDVASENAVTAMGFDTSTFSPCLHHSSAADMSVFRHGDDFVVSGTRAQQKNFEVELSKPLIVKHLATSGTMHSTSGRHRSQKIEQVCEMGHTSIWIGT